MSHRGLATWAAVIVLVGSAPVSSFGQGRSEAAADAEAAWWEGDALVVETTNFNERRRFQGATEAMRVVERFTRVADVADDRITYEFTVEDPDTWTRPWSAEVPMVTTEGPMYEYACHEGNHDIRHILEIYRNLERQAAEAEAAESQEVEHGLTPLVLEWESADWGPPTSRPGFPAGLRNAPVATDPATGGPTYFARFPAGSEFAMHWLRGRA